MKRTIVFIVTVLCFAVAFVLAACGGNGSGGTGDTSSRGSVSLQEILVLPHNNAFNGDTEHNVCLDVRNDEVELFDLRIRLENRDKCPISYIVINGKTINAEDFGNGSSENDIYINNITVSPDSESYTYSLTEIVYSVGDETRHLKNIKNNSVTVMIDPDFELTLDMSEADTDNKTVVKKVNYMAKLPLPSDSDMNDDLVYGHPDLIFTGWYTEAEGGEKVVAENYVYYHDVTFYARYARAFKYTSDGEEITITGLTEEGKQTSNSINIPAELDGLPVTAIGDRAFASAGAGKTFILADTVKRIGEYAFYGAARVTVIMKGVTEIGYAAFLNAGLISLGYLGKSAELPLTLEVIDDYAFSGTGFNTVFQTAGSSVISTFQLSLFLPRNVRYLGDSAFENSLFKAVYIPSGTKLNTGIMPEADDDGYDFTEYQTGEGVFRDSSALETVITGYTFDDKGNIVDAKQGGLEVISDYMFYNCHKLKTASGNTGLTLTAGLRIIGSKAFSSENVSGSNYGMPQLKALTMPDSLQYIGASAFANAPLQSVTFGSASELVSIGNWCFQESAMTEITFYSLSVYGKAPFYGNTDIVSIYILSDKVPKYVSPGILDGGDTVGRNARFYVKTAKISAFRNAEGWKDSSTPILAYEYINKNEGYVFEPVDADGNIEVNASSGFAKVTYLFSGEREVTVPHTVFDPYGKAFEVTDIGSYVTVDSASDNLPDTINTVRLPDSVIRISDSAFYGATKLTDVKWTYVDGDNFIRDYDAGDVSGLNLKTIGKYAFKYTSLTGFVSPASLEKIGGEAFMYSALTRVDLRLGNDPEIGVSAFSNNMITLLHIGAVRSVGSTAFAYQTGGAVTVYFTSSVPPELASDDLFTADPFTGCTVSKAVVPSPAYNDYYNSGFSSTLKNKYATE